VDQVEHGSASNAGKLLYFHFTSRLGVNYQTREMETLGTLNIVNAKV
jgi:hypothetical protein